MSNKDIIEHTAYIKSSAQKMGFDYCGISKAEYLETEASRLRDWLQKGHHGKMDYMDNHFDKRVDPTKLVKDSKSVVSLLYNYYPKTGLKEKDNYKIAKYAYGKDYHFLIKDKLKELLTLIQQKISHVEGRVFEIQHPSLNGNGQQKADWVGLQKYHADQ